MLPNNKCFGCTGDSVVVAPAQTLSKRGVSVVKTFQSTLLATWASWVNATFNSLFILPPWNTASLKWNARIVPKLCPGLKGYRVRPERLTVGLQILYRLIWKSDRARKTVLHLQL